MRTFIVDIDGTICTDSRGRYELARPMKTRIDYFNSLFDSGNTIIYWTARGANSGKDWSDFTKKQLEGWGVKYTELKTDKPAYDFWIDDKAYNGNRFFDELYF
jgi:hypothetical protein